MKSNGAFKGIHNNAHKAGGPIPSGVLRDMEGEEKKKAYPKPLRKIKYKDTETEKAYEFLTNDMGREAEEIAGIQGALGSRIIFQVDKAAFKILLWINRTLDGITASPYELMMLMKSALLTKNSLIGLCTNIELHRKLITIFKVNNSPYARVGNLTANYTDVYELSRILI
jgi:hypothetical protein